MRKSSFERRISGVPLRIRNENGNTSSQKGRVSAPGRKPSLGSSKPSGTRMSFLPKTGRPSSGIGVRGRTDVPKDPRPLSDKRYQQQSIKRLLEFLINNNYPHAISQKLLVSPTSKDFFKIFEFIYGKLSPGYKMVPKMEEEFPRVLKMLGYPFTLSKTHLFSVGSPHTWPYLCAALVWIIDIILTAESIHSNGGVDAFIFDASSEEDFDGSPEEKIIFEYCEQTFAAFMAGADSFTKQDEDLEKFLTQKYQGGNIQEISEEIRRLESEQSLGDQAEKRLHDLQEHIATIKQDELATQHYLKELEQYKRSINNDLKEREEAIKMLNSDLELEKSRNAEMQALYDQQDLTPSDVDRLKAEQGAFRNQVDQFEKLVEDVDSNNWKVSMDMSRLLEKVENGVRAYSQLAITLKLVPETAELANGKDFRLRTSFNSDIVSNADFNVKPKLKMMKNQCLDNLRRKNKEQFQLKCELEQCQESVNERKDRVRQKEKELAAIEVELESMKQQIQTGKKSVLNEVETVKQDWAQYESALLSLETAKSQAEQDYQDARRLKDSQQLTLKKELSNLEEVRAKIRKTVEAHKESFKKQIAAFVSHLKTANAEMEKSVSQLQKESQKRDAWLRKLQT